MLFSMIVIDLNELEKKEEELGTTAALIRGVAAGMEAGGWQIGGFLAYVTSDVPMGQACLLQLHLKAL